MVRGFPNGIFNPWARWITGLALAKNSSAAAAAAVALDFWKSREWKLEIGNLKIWDRQTQISFSGLPDDADRSVSKS